MPSVKAYIDPHMLTWARRTANLEPLAAARKIKVPEGRVEEWEAGERLPTIAELRRAGTVYNRPLGVFYLSAPPTGFETLRDFRRIDLHANAEWSVDLYAEYRRAHDQRDALLDIADLDDQPPSTAWRLTGLPDNDDGIANRARAFLQDVAPAPFPRTSADEYTHLGYWTTALEEAGVLVTHTAGGRVSTDEMRAFSLYFDTVPVIALNGADYPRGRLFSLLHEYAHLLLNTAGLCDTRTDQRAITEDRQIEARCNATAAAILMPGAEILASDPIKNHPTGQPWTLPELLEAAQPYGVSAEAYLRRLVTLRRIPMAEYQQFRSGYSRDDVQRAKPGGGNFYVNKARDLGKGYVRTVTSAHRRSLIDSTTAATYLDVKVAQIPELASKAKLR